MPTYRNDRPRAKRNTGYDSLSLSTIATMTFPTPKVILTLRAQGLEMAIIVVDIILIGTAETKS
jgi:hypothetical protein